MKRFNTLANYLIGFILIAIFSTGCTTEKQYRTNPNPILYDSQSSATNHAMIEVSSNYTLGYVEFDDQGWLYGKSKSQQQLQIDTVTARIADEAKTNGLLMIAFVHGWKHNASECDSNVIMFHSVLNEVAAMEQKLSRSQSRPARRIVGVYIGWRGLSLKVPYLENLTFWERKNTAEQVGHGAVIELLSQLEQIKQESNREFKNAITNHQRMNTKLVIVGHSFGGDIVYSATAPILTERMIENYDNNGDAQPPKTLGDLVVLINPAFEAARFETLQRLAATKPFPPGKNCTLAVFTSTGDEATGIAFPLGRIVSTLFDTYEKGIDQRNANITAVGHYAPYITHTLKVLEPAGRKTLLSTNEVSETTSAARIMALRDKIHNSSRKSRDTITTNDLTYTFTHCQLIPTTNAVPNDPVFNVAVDPRIIPDHNAINRPIFIRFLSEFLFTFSSDE